jgi:hypothetical protein
MPERLHRRLGGHVRRHSIAYAVLALAVSISPAPSMAADLITTPDIANGAVTTPKLAADSVVGGKIANDTVAGVDIKNGGVGAADLADSAKGAKVIRYDLGSHDFSDSALIVQLPGSWDANVVTGSTWSAIMQQAAGLSYYAVPGHGVAGSSDYRLFVYPHGELHIDAATGSGEPYVDIRVYRTVVTSTQAVPPQAP